MQADVARQFGNEFGFVSDRTQDKNEFEARGEQLSSTVSEENYIRPSCGT
jgi:hypothetical protein